MGGTGTTWRIGASIIAILLCWWGAACCDPLPAHLDRVDIYPHSAYTRLFFKLDVTPRHTLTRLGAGKVRLVLRNTVARPFPRVTAYRDTHLAGISISQRGDDLRVTVTAREETPGVRFSAIAEAGLITFDIGPLFKPSDVPDVMPGRERILSGVAALIGNFDPPLTTDLPFHPTDQRILEKLLSRDDLKAFMAGEASLYQGDGAAAAEAFAPFARQESPIRSLACYRLGEALYLLQKYGEALAAFKEGARLWPDFLTFDPTVTFLFGDSIARSGDLAGGRRFLCRLITEFAASGQAPLLLARLADVLDRQGERGEANSIYRMLADHFPTDRAGFHAAMKLADRRILALSPFDYESLEGKYRLIYSASGDFVLRELALFKGALVSSLYGPARQALAQVIDYQAKYPRGVFAGVVRGMREELLFLVYRDMVTAGDFDGLVPLALGNREYLARCFSDPAFPGHLAKAFGASGRLKEETVLFRYLAEREWGAPAAPYLLARVFEAALILADQRLAEQTGRLYLALYPGAAEAARIAEGLGGLLYQKGDLAGARTELAFLADGHHAPLHPESLYYLGKAWVAGGDCRRGGETLELYLDRLRGLRQGSPLVPDAYFVAAECRLKRQDYRGGLSLLEAGLSVSGPAREDQFLYKLGETTLRLGRREDARQYWERAASGKDPDWQKMAQQSLDDLTWQERVAGRLPVVSK